MLNLTADPISLTAELVDIPSVSGNERAIADEVERALAALPHFRVFRDGDAVVARTEWGRGRRIVLAGHLDTVPVADNLPSYRDGDVLYGCGTTDMKSGVAAMLHLAALAEEAGHPRYDLTVIAYDHEEVAAVKNGLGRLSRNNPQWIQGDMAIVLEPTNGALEAGCQGSIRALVRATGRRAHAARGWLGENAIHALAEPLHRLVSYQPRQVSIDGCVFREGLNAVRIEGGVAGNVIPDESLLEVGFRFGPDRSVEGAVEHVREFFSGYDVSITDSSPAAPPGLTAPAVAEFVAALGLPVTAKYGWTDVARFAERGIPAINFGPGDPNLAHTRNENVDTRRIAKTTQYLRTFLLGS